MADRGGPSSPKKPLKFRRRKSQSRSHSHTHHHHGHHHHHPHHHHDIHDTESEGPAPRPSSGPPTMTGTDVSLRVESPAGSNDLFIVDVFDGGVSGKAGHTSVAIYSSGSANNTAFPAFPRHPDPPPRRANPKSKPPEFNTISQTGDPRAADKNDVFRTIRKNFNEWGSRLDVDTQEVANDTLDLDRIMFTTPFLLNFRHYDELEISLHVGLRKKNKLPFLNPSTFIPPTTDDYNREVFRYLKTQPKLQALKLILEVHSDDDNLTYKTFEQDAAHKSGGSGGGGMIIGTGNDFPVIRSKVGSFWTGGQIPVGLTFLHVELPGLSSFYLNDWKRLMELQSELGTLICNFGAVLWNFYENTVRNNEKSLGRVVLRRVISYDVKNQRHLPLDFAMFRNCKKLSYLKITGGGYKERWGDWVNNFVMSQSREELPQQEMLLYVNFDTIPVENLVEFHYSKMTVNKKLLHELAVSGRNKKLQVICADCPDREYYDGDWEIYCQNGDEDGEQPVDNPEIAVMVGGMRHVEYYKQRQRQKTYIIICLLVLTIIAFFTMTVAIGVAISTSNEGRHERN